MALFILQHLLLTAVVCSMTSRATEVSATYKRQMNATGSKMCAIDKPSTVIPMSVRAMRVQCGGKCNGAPSCKLFQLREDLKQCQLFIYSPWNFAAVDHCTAYADEHPPTTPTLVSTLTGTLPNLATALFNDQLFVSRASNTNISVYNTSTFQTLRSFTFPGLGGVFGLAASAISNWLFLADWNHGCVHRVDLSVTGSVSVVSWSVPGAPRGLSMTSGNNVLVAINSGAIAEYTPSGSFVRTITTSPSPWQAVQVNNDVWAYSAPPNRQICTTLTNGTVLKCFGSVAGPGLALAMNNVLSLMVIHSSGYMFLVDSSNNRVIVIDPFLSSARQLQFPVTPALQCPQSLSYDQSSGRLYIGESCGQGRILVFEDIW